MAEPVVIRVLGRPAPQGSKRAFVIRGGPRKGQAAVIESSHDRVKSWRQAVVDEARAAAGWGEMPPLAGPLEVSMVFVMPRPKSHYRTGRNDHLLRDSAPAYPHGKPDLSKLCRATEDALTDAGIWADDAQVVHYEVLAKRWEGHAQGLPGAVITIRAWT
jgi:crossover junction endodeoxyribonuclease RusA